MDRTERCELLAQLTDAEIGGIARLVLDGTVPEPTLITPPTVGMLMARIAEGAHGDVFNVGEVLVTECHVQVGASEGWSMVMGSRPRAALRAAMIDAVLSDGAPDRASGTAAVDARLIELAAARLAAMRHERAGLAETRVQFQTQ